MPIGNRLTNPGRQLKNHFYGGESDTAREIPPDWRAALDLTIYEIPLPWDQDIIPLSDTVLASKAVQSETSEWIRRTTYKPPGPVVLLERFTSKNKEFGTRTRTFDWTGNFGSVPSPTQLQDVRTNNFGNEHFETVVDSIPGLFTEQVYQLDRPEVWPERFRAQSPLRTDRHLETGVATWPPPLVLGDVHRAEQQEDLFTKRAEYAYRNYPSLPTAPLFGQRYEDTFDLVIPYQEWIDVAGTNLGNPRTIVTPQGDGTEQVEQLDFSSVSAALNAYHVTFPSTVNLSQKLPDKLTDLVSVFEVNSGNGTYSESGAAYWTHRGSYSLPIRGSGTASAATTSDANFLLEPPFFPVKPTTRVVFFLPNTPPITPAIVLAKLTTILGASVGPWPNFDPKPVTVICVSRKVSVRCEANQHVQSGGSQIDGDDPPCDVGDCPPCDAASTTGTGTSTEVGISIKTLRIPQCIHGLINLHDTHVETATAQAFASVGTSVGVCLPPSYGPADTGVITLSAIGSVDCNAAATTVTDYPSTGKVVLDITAQPYKYGFSMIHAEVFDFADL